MFHSSAEKKINGAKMTTTPRTLDYFATTGVNDPGAAVDSAGEGSTSPVVDFMRTADDVMMCGNCRGSGLDKATHIGKCYVCLERKREQGRTSPGVSLNDKREPTKSSSLVLPAGIVDLVDHMITSKL